jgi:hypothetical protein
VETLHGIQVPEVTFFVNIRPGWDDLKSYIITTGRRRRYKVYVCTMAGRDYALEAWRLLDPAGCLISPDKISRRLVCVRRGKLLRVSIYYFALMRLKRNKYVDFYLPCVPQVIYFSEKDVIMLFKKCIKY